MINQFAIGLIEFGVSQTDTVAFFSDNSVQCLVAMLSTITLGITFAPISTLNKACELYNTIDVLNSTVLVFGKTKMSVIKQMMDDDKYNSVINRHKLIIQLETRSTKSDLITPEYPTNLVKTFEQILYCGQGKRLPKIPYFDTKPNDPFIVVFTSGTTGTPKGVIHTHRTYLPHTSKSLIKSQMVYSLWNPVGHSTGVMSMLMLFAHRITTVLLDDHNIETILKAVEKYSVNATMMSPSQGVQMVKNDYHLQYNLQSLKVLVSWGCKLPLEVYLNVKEKYKVHIVNNYGATEVTEVTISSIAHKDGSVGVVAPGIEMKIVDQQTGEPLPPNHKGEICFRGRTCFVGYLNNPTATKEALRDEGWYHSGDVGYYDEQGFLFIVDRIKELIKYKMWSIAPAEIEDFLCSHDAVESACVVGVKHIQDNQLVRAYVKLSAGKQTTTEELCKYVEDNLGFHKRLRGGVTFVKHIPHTSIGKVDRKYFKNLIKDELLIDDVV